MPVLIFILLVILIANVGFWDTFQAILGAIGVVILFWLLVGGLLAAIGGYLWTRIRSRF